MIRTGHVTEVYEFEKMPCRVHVGGGRTKEQSADWMRHWKTSAKRKRDYFRRLVTANFGNDDLFVTLTFRDGAVTDVTDVQECYKAFRRFRERLRRRYPDMRALVVPEFQDANGRGAVHYHMICNLTYIPHDELTELWGYGFVWVNSIEHVDNVGAYLTKYMSKSMIDARMRGLKAYYRFGKLKEPDVVWGDDPAMVKEIVGDSKPIFRSLYGSEYHGRILYSQYNTKRSHETWDGVSSGAGSGTEADGPADGEGGTR